MITPELLQFIKNELAKNISKDAISVLLKTQGWTDLDITEAFNQIEKEKMQTQTQAQIGMQAQAQVGMDPQMIAKEVPKEIPVEMPKENNFGITKEIEKDNFNNGFTATNIMSTNVSFDNNFIPEEKPKSRWYIWVILFIVLLFGLAFTYTMGYFTPIEKTLFNYKIESMNSFNFNTIMNVDLSKMKKDTPEISPVITLGETPDSAKVEISGAYDGTDKENIKSEISFGLGIKEDLDLVLNMKYLEKKIYMAMTKAPDLGFISLSPFENKWVHFTEEDIKNNLNGENSSFSFNMDFGLNKYTDEQKENLKNILDKSKAIKITKRHLPEMIDGVLAYNFEFNINNEEFIKTTDELFTYLMSIDSSISENQKQQIIDSMNNISDKVTFSGQAWVGVLDNIPRKQILNLNYSDPQKGESNAVIISSFSNINKPVVIEIPKESMSIDEVTGYLKDNFDSFDPFSKINKEIPDVDYTFTNENISDKNNFGLSGIDLEMKNIIEKIAVDAEMFLAKNKTYYGFCSSKGEIGAYHLAITLPKNTVYKCNDSNMAFASWAKLSNGKYFCVDSSGKSKLVGLPKGTECPLQ